MSANKEACAMTQAYAFSRCVEGIMDKERVDFCLAAEKAKVEFSNCTLAICFTFSDGSVAIFDGNGFLIKR